MKYLVKISILLNILIFAFALDVAAQYVREPGRTTTGDFEEPITDVVKRENYKNRFPIAYPYVRESDQMWTKRVWREIDFIQKKNHLFYFPKEPSPGRASLASIIFDSIKSGSIIAYEHNEPMRFQMPMTPPQFEKSLSLESSTSITQQMSDGSQRSVDTVIKNMIRPSDVIRIRLMEDWFFDKQRSMFESRIIGIGFIVKNPDGKLQTKFWIYYPHARRVLARSENIPYGGNRSHPYSYAMIFEKRRFSSLITKADNVYDRYINAYTKGQEALYESERIKRELLEFEGNLWEY